MFWQPINLFCFCISRLLFEWRVCTESWVCFQAHCCPNDGSICLCTINSTGNITVCHYHLSLSKTSYRCSLWITSFKTNRIHFQAWNVKLNSHQVSISTSNPGLDAQKMFLIHCVCLFSKDCRINRYFAISWALRILWFVPWGLVMFLESRQAVTWAQEINIFVILWTLYPRLNIQNICSEI